MKLFSSTFFFNDKTKDENKKAHCVEFEFLISEEMIKNLWNLILVLFRYHFPSHEVLLSFLNLDIPSIFPLFANKPTQSPTQSN